MNRLEAGYRIDNTFPKAPIGLDLSCLKSGLLISRIRNARLQAVGSFVLMVSVVACGTDKEAIVSTPSLTSKPATPVVTEVFISTPTPTVVEASKSAIPEDAQKLLNDFSSLSAFKPEENEAIAKDFAVIWKDANTEFRKYGSYSHLYGILWAKYNITRDSAVLLEMNKVEQTIAQKWPAMYQTDASNNGFYREPTNK